MNLKAKLILGGLGIVIFVMIASGIVFSMIFSNQNRKSVVENLEKSIITMKRLILPLDLPLSEKVKN